jgi:hypothetical protein
MLHLYETISGTNRMFVETNCFPLQVDLWEQRFVQVVTSGAVLSVSAGYLRISFYLHFVTAFMKT